MLALAVDNERHEHNQQDAIFELWRTVLEQAYEDLKRFPPGHRDSPIEWFQSKSLEPGCYRWIKNLVDEKE